MIEISLAFIAVIALISMVAFILINKYLNQRQEELEIKYRINNIVADTTPIDALTKKIDKLDERINNNCSSISSIKQELEAFKLSMGLKGRI